MEGVLNFLSSAGERGYDSQTREMNFMSVRSTCRSAVSIILAVATAPLFAQWVDYPTSGVPRTADGKPDLAAPAPRGADGKPDFSGMWGWENRFNCGAKCNDTQISREFTISPLR